MSTPLLQVRKLERYRLLEPKFDHYLSERRQGLLFEETLSDILIDVSEPNILSYFSPLPKQNSFSRPHPPAKTTSSPRTGGSPLPTLRSNVSSPATPQLKKTGWSIFSPLKRTPVKTTPLDANSLPPSSPKPQSTPLTPYADHYSATVGLKVESLVAESPKKGMWSPASTKRDMRFNPRAQRGDNIYEVDSEDESSDGGGRVETLAQIPNNKVSLSQVLDNVVVSLSIITSLETLIRNLCSSLVRDLIHSRSWRNVSRSWSRFE